jgi:hypothetical protein
MDKSLNKFDHDQFKIHLCMAENLKTFEHKHTKYRILKKTEIIKSLISVFQEMN